MSRRVESGIRNYRVDFAREDSFGEVVDPEFLKYSTVMNTFGWTSDSVNEPQLGLGSADPYDFLKGPESHEFTIEYDFTRWFVDTSGDPLDASYDAIMRDNDNLLPNSHTIVSRQAVEGTLAAENTVNGSNPYGTRLYSVGRGGLIDEAELVGDTSDAQAVQVALTYLVQKGRSYQIDQPDASTQLVVASTDENDTMDVTVESEDGSTSETLTLDGTTLVSTTDTFDDVDAFELAEEAVGNVQLSINEADETSPTEGDQLAEISGADEYEGVEGDLGVPAVGSGSRETSVSNAEIQKFVGDRILKASEPYPHEIPSATLTVANNVEEQELSSGYGMGLHSGERETNLEATMYGENTSHKMLEQHLKNSTNTHTWEMTGGNLELVSGVLNEPGGREAEEGQAIMTTDNTFRFVGINIA